MVSDGRLEVTHDRKLDVHCDWSDCRTIGLPPVCDWPEGVSVRHSSFRLTPPVPLQSLVPELDRLARDLMEVRSSQVCRGFDPAPALHPAVGYCGRRN